MKIRIIPYHTLAIVLKQYGEDLLTASPLSSLYAHEVAYGVRTVQGMRVIKPWMGNFQQLQQLARLVETLHKIDYPYAPIWLSTLDGAAFVATTGHRYYVTDWVQGTPFVPTRDTCNAVGLALAKLHQLTASPPIKAVPHPHNRNQNRPVTQPHPTFWLQQLEKRAALFQKDCVRVCKDTTVTGTWFRAHGPACQQMTRQGLMRLAQPQVKRHLHQEWNHPYWLHGDITIPNIVQVGSNVVLLDWDRAHPGSPATELAKALANVCGFSPDLMANFMRGYTEFRPLPRAERLATVACLHLPWEAWNGLRKLFRGQPAPELPPLRQSWSVRLEGLAWARQWAASAELS
ncbi:hypothetical protein D2Q93_01820 [Alicyclobacillaceae bacterium I2511]|nr:hypothetical protein D2Q93_01820 [Alicyclobacillaceae bacterium I2511]